MGRLPFFFVPKSRCVGLEDAWSGAKCVLHVSLRDFDACFSGDEGEGYSMATGDQDRPCLVLVERVPWLLSLLTGLPRLLMSSAPRPPPAPRLVLEFRSTETRDSVSFLIQAAKRRTPGFAESRLLALHWHFRRALSALHVRELQAARQTPQGGQTPQ
eukprot:Polyplicarium_translucidae@DN5342_c0_g1_i1.p1